MVLHCSDLLRREQGTEAAELALRDACAVRPPSGGLGTQNLFRRAEPLGDVLLGRQILTAGVDVDRAVSQDRAGVLAVGGAELGEGLGRGPRRRSGGSGA